MKELSEMTWEEFVSYATWSAIQQLTQGTALRTVVSDVCWAAMQWKGEQDTKKAKKKKP